MKRKKIYIKIYDYDCFGCSKEPVYVNRLSRCAEMRGKLGTFEADEGNNDSSSSGISSCKGFGKGRAVANSA